MVANNYINMLVKIKTKLTCITHLLDVVSLTTIECILLGFGRILVILYDEKVFIVQTKTFV